MSTNDIDLSSVEFLANPFPTYHKLREANAPFWLAHRGPTGGMWLVTRDHDVETLLKEAHTTKDATCFTPPKQVTPFDHNLLGKDPPDHTRLRSLANQALTPGRVKDLEPRIQHIVDELLAQVQPHGSMECMADFALPLPVTVIAEWLGVPPEDHDTFHAWSNHMVTGFDAVRRSEAHVKHTQAATLALGQYFADLIRRRRQQPRDDLISALPLARDAQDRLTEDELLAMCMVLLIAGHETTVNLLGNGVLTLLRHPTQLALLKHHPELLPSAVEELFVDPTTVLRWGPC